MSEDGWIVLYKRHRLLLSCTSCLLAPTEQLLGTETQTGSCEWTGAGTVRQEAVRETLAASVRGVRLRGPQPHIADASLTLLSSSCLKLLGCFLFCLVLFFKYLMGVRVKHLF